VETEAGLILLASPYVRTGSGVNGTIGAMLAVGSGLGVVTGGSSTGASVGSGANVGALVAGGSVGTTEMIGTVGAGAGTTFTFGT
jgi:hypothetical protein